MRSDLVSHFFLIYFLILSKHLQAFTQEEGEKPRAWWKISIFLHFLRKKKSKNYNLFSFLMIRSNSAALRSANPSWLSNTTSYVGQGDSSLNIHARSSGICASWFIPCLLIQSTTNPKSRKGRNLWCRLEDQGAKKQEIPSDKAFPPRVVSPQSDLIKLCL